MRRINLAFCQGLPETEGGGFDEEKDEHNGECAEAQPGQMRA
jgi:hypothetical protein